MIKCGIASRTCFNRWKSVFRFASEHSNPNLDFAVGIRRDARETPEAADLSEFDHNPMNERRFRAEINAVQSSVDCIGDRHIWLQCVTALESPCSKGGVYGRQSGRTGIRSLCRGRCMSVHVANGWRK